MHIKLAVTYDLQETGHEKLTGQISCNAISKLCNWKLIILQAKIPGGAVEAEGIGHQTHGGRVPHNILHEEKGRGKTEKK